ncbi:MAG: hypothetical protein AAGA73_24795 [Pseudomonadota bacterium]
MASPHRPRPLIQLVAATLDLFIIFIPAAFTAATFAGSITPTGNQLNGWPALCVFALTGLYVVFGKKLFGGTIWQRLLKI